jgi:hypothetical protein
MGLPEGTEATAQPVSAEHSDCEVVAVRTSNALALVRMLADNDHFTHLPSAQVAGALAVVEEQLELILALANSYDP